MGRQIMKSAAICIATKTASDESTGGLILRVKGSRAWCWEKVA